MVPASGNRLRVHLFLALLATWAGWRCLDSLPRIFWQEPGRNLEKLELALSPVPEELYLPLALTPEMVELIRAELPEAGKLYLYRLTSRDPKLEDFETTALERQVLRCSQYFFPRRVLGLRSREEAVAAIAATRPLLIADYSLEADSPFHQDYEIVSEQVLVRLWRRKPGS